MLFNYISSVVVIAVKLRFQGFAQCVTEKKLKGLLDALLKQFASDIQVCRMVM